MPNWDLFRRLAESREQARVLATRLYMIQKQRNRVCFAAKIVIDRYEGANDEGDLLVKLQKEVRKLRALEGEL